MSFGSPYFTLPEFEYAKPTTLPEALELLNRHGDDAKVMAGGVGLLAFMKERLMEPTHVIDVKGIPELRRLRYLRGAGLTIGAAVPMNEVLNHPIVKARYKALYDCLHHLSDTALRNRSTIVGDLCEALPFIDSPPPLIIFDAIVEAASVTGRRRIPVQEFLVGTAQTALNPNELVVALHLPEPPEGANSGFLKHAIGGEFSVVNLAALVVNPEEPSKRVVKLAYGAVTPLPMTVPEAEAIFRKGAPVQHLIAEAIAIVLKTITPMTDISASMEYRRHLMEVMSWKLLTALFQRRGE